MIIMFFVAVIVGNFWRLELPGQFLWFILKAQPFNIYLVITINIPACLMLRPVIGILFGFFIFNLFHKKQSGIPAPIFASLNCGLCAPPLVSLRSRVAPPLSIWQFFHPSWIIIILKGGAANGNYIRFWALW